jgi:hypothetical protein
MVNANIPDILIEPDKAVLKVNAGPLMLVDLLFCWGVVADMCRSRRNFAWS